MLSLSDLHKYQIKSRDFILDNNNCGLFQQCGLGKTVSTLTAISDLLRQREVRKVLVVSTLRVANTVWHTEVKEWEHLQHLTVSRIIGNAVQRKEAINGAVIHTINIENLPWLVREACRTNFPYDFVVFDESSLLKNSSSQRFKAAKAMLSALSRVVILTGSPAANGVHDLWSQIYLLDRGQRLGKNITQFRNKWFRQNRFYGYDPLPNALTEIPARIEDICLSMKADDYLDVPEMIENEIEIELSASAKKIYKDMRKQLLVEINNTDIESPTAATLVNKCQQISNGFLYDEQKNIHVLHENKLDALESIIEETESPILIFYTFKADLEAIKKRFAYVATLEKDSDLTIQMWNNEDIPLLCCHPACLHPSTEVLTEHRGWIKIIDVKTDERVFDGIEFVNHSGCHFSGVKEVIDVMGITMTKNHKILIDNEWVEAKNVQNNIHTRRKANYSYSGTDSYLSTMLPLRRDTYTIKTKCFKGKQRWQKALFKMHKRKLPFNDKHKNLAYLAWDVKSNDKRIQSQLYSIWRKWHRCCKRMAGFQEFLFRYGRNIFGQFDFRSNRQFKRLFQKQLSMGNKYGATSKQNKQQGFSLQRKTNALVRILQSCQHRSWGNNSSFEFGDDTRRSCGRLFKFEISKKPKFSEVFDLVNCGSRNRFLVRNNNGDVFISHNSAGHGLNLQKGGNTIVWYGLTFSWELFEQANSRLHRQGQRKNVFVHYLLGSNTIDHLVLKALRNKERVQNSVFEQLKALDKS